MSKIAFFCIPAQGHTNPTLGVVKELVRRGNQVRYYSYDLLKEKIQATGAEYVSCDGFDIQMQLTPEDGERIAKDIAFSTEIIVKTTLAMDDAIIDEMTEWKPDCIVADSMAMQGKLAALKLGVPFMSSTTTFAFNRYSVKVMNKSAAQQLSMLFAMPKVNRQIKKLKDKGYPVKNLFSIILNDNQTNTIVYTSPEFQPYADTFSDKYTFVGPSIRETEGNVEKPQRKTVYISMGTVNNSKLSFYKNCIAALKDADADVIMSVGGLVDMEAIGEAPANFTIARSVDQMAVLQKADAFLTHCGMNSVNEALYFSVPLVLYPQTAEQGGVANRVSELGAGLHLTGDSPEAIISAVNAVMSDASYKKCAQEISEGFRRCGGAALAADKIEELARKA